MDQQLKERLIGVTALVLVAIVFIPMFFKKSTDLALREKENVEFINENESEFISKYLLLKNNLAKNIVHPHFFSGLAMGNQFYRFAVGWVGI